MLVETNLRIFLTAEKLRAVSPMINRPAEPCPGSIGSCDYFALGVLRSFALQEEGGGKYQDDTGATHFLETGRMGFAACVTPVRTPAEFVPLCI